MFDGKKEGPPSIGVDVDFFSWAETAESGDGVVAELFSVDANDANLYFLPGHIIFTSKQFRGKTEALRLSAAIFLSKAVHFKIHPAIFLGINFIPQPDNSNNRSRV
ncbi:MAG TPA: hypothetical protein VIF64_20710 [Pyrinomonadaceae bacterium]